MEFFLLGLLVGVTAASLTLLRWPSSQHVARTRASPSTRTASPGSAENAAPGTQATCVKPRFFTHSEKEFFHALEQALPPGFRAFPNVRLGDIFVSAPPALQDLITRLQHEPVSFLIVAVADARPVLAIALSDTSDDHAAQQRRDELKALIFDHAGLLLLRLRSHDPLTRASLEATLWERLRPGERYAVP